MKLLYLYVSTLLILLAPLSFAQNIVNIEFLNATVDDSSNNTANIKSLSLSEDKKSDEFTFKVVSISNGTENTYSEQKVSKLSELNLSLENGTYKFYVFRQNDTSLVEYNNNSDGYNVISDSVIILSYPQTAGYILDIPWRIEKSEEYIPVLAISKDWLLPEIYNISVYDALNNDTLIETTNWTERRVLLFESIPYFQPFNISKNRFLKNEHNRISVKVKFGLKYIDLIYVEIWKGPVNMSISDEDFPKANNWFYGDTHVHSEYTNNPAEYGAPIYATSEAINAIGLNWMTITDHSFDQTNLSTKWNDYLHDCEADKRCLRAEEVSCDWGFLGGYSHYLSYNTTTFISGPEIYWGDTDTCETVINKVNAEGFGYVAHPEHEDGLRWKWKNYSLPFTGLEVWNSIGEPWETERDQAIQKWVEQLLLSRKIFISAGSDAHGDFNSALGKVRTACFAQNFTKDNIFIALRNGNCMMTDGPLVTFTANKHIIGESFNVSEGDTILLNISWNSTNEFGNVTEIFLIRGEINGNETNETVITPNNLSGDSAIISAPNSTYYRIEARSIDPDGIARRAYTNPIWIYAEPRPEMEKIPMDETEHALVTAFEEKYDHTLKDLFFDGWPPLDTCQAETLRENLGLGPSWSVVKCEKLFLNGSRVMWAGFSSPDISEKKIVLQIDSLLLFANATQNNFIVNWTVRSFNPGYENYNWIAEKNGKEIFEINEIYSVNDRHHWVYPSYFGTFLIHGFTQHEGNTTAYYSHWGPDYVWVYNIHNVYMSFDGKVTYPLEYEGFVYNTDKKFKRGVFQKRSFNHTASAFKLGADGEFEGGWGLWISSAGFDPINRSIFPVIRGEAIVNCHADAGCNDNDISTKDICLNKGTVNSGCIHLPEEPEEIKEPYTGMDAEEISKAIEFKEMHGKPLGELYFDGSNNTTCNNAVIRNTLKLNGSWSVLQCKKYIINSTRVMFAGLNNTATGEQYAAYQIGNILVGDGAIYKERFEDFRINPFSIAFYRSFVSRWVAFHNKTQRFEIDVFQAANCNDEYTWCNQFFPYATYIIHGIQKDGNKNARAFYSFKGYQKKLDIGPFIKIIFDNYKGFYLENETIGSYDQEAIYKTRLFEYNAARGWAFGTNNPDYRANNQSLFSPYKAGEMMVELGSPAHILVNDSKGKLTGYFNGSYIAEIPGSEIINKAHEKYRIPSGGDYSIYVTGHETGNYSLKITVPASGSGGVFYFRNISASDSTQDIFGLNGSGAIGIRTKDAEKAIYLEVENTENPPASLNFTIANGKSAGIAVLDWNNISSGSVTLKENRNHPPEIISSYPENNSAFCLWCMVAISVNASDADNDTLGYRIMIDGNEISNAEKINYTLNETGAHNITFAVSDGINIVSRETFVRVFAGPVITIAHPQNRTYNNSAIFLNATFAEAADTAWISIDGKGPQNLTYGASGIGFYLEPLSEGWHSVTVFANSSAGEMNFSTALFSIDTMAPEMTIVAPMNGATLPAGTSSVAINIATDESAICKYGASGSGFDYSAGLNFSSTGGKSHSLQYGGLSNGMTYSIYYLCSDNYGNINGMPLHHTFSINPSGNGNGNNGNGGGGSGGGNAGNGDKDKDHKKNGEKGKHNEKNKDDGKKPKNTGPDSRDTRNEKEHKINDTSKEAENAQENNSTGKITGRAFSIASPLFSKIFAWLRSFFSVLF